MSIIAGNSDPGEPLLRDGPPVNIQDLTKERMTRAVRHWSNQMSDRANRRVMMVHTTDMFNRQVTKAALTTWNHLSRVVWAVKYLGRAVFSTCQVPLQEWYKTTFIPFNQLSNRNSVAEVHAISDLQGRSMADVSLKSGERRWLQVSCIHKDHKSASKLDKWQEKNGFQVANTPTKNKKLGLEAWVNRANDIQRAKDSDASMSPIMIRRKTPAKAAAISRNTQGLMDNQTDANKPGSQEKPISSEKGPNVEVFYSGEDVEEIFGKHSRETQAPKKAVTAIAKKAPAPAKPLDQEKQDQEARSSQESNKPNLTSDTANLTTAQTIMLSQQRAEAAEHRSLQLQLKLSKLLSLQSQEDHLSDEQIADQAAKAAAAIIIKANEEDQRAAAAEAHAINLENALEELVGKVATVPSPLRSPPRPSQVQEPAQEKHDQELELQLTLLKDAAEAEELRKQSVSDEEQWSRISRMQGDDNQPTNSSAPGPQHQSNAAPEVSRLFNNAASAPAGDRRMDAMMEKLNTLNDMVINLTTKQLSGAQAPGQVTHEDYSKRELYEAINKHVTLIAEQFRKPSQRSKICIDPECHKQQTLGAHWCPCGAPRSCLDLKCHAPGCETWLVGSVKECMQQQDCLICFQKLITSYTSAEKNEKALALQKLAALPKVSFVFEAPTKIANCMTKKTKVTKTDNAITILVRLSNPEHNFIVGQGLHSVADILSAIFHGCTSGEHHILGSPVNFEVTGKAILAMLKGFTMGFCGEYTGDEFIFYATEIHTKSKKYMSKSTVAWSKTLLESVASKFDFSAPDAAAKLEKVFEHLTELLKRTLGLLIALEHAEVCAVLMGAHYGEEFPQVEFTLELVFYMHCAAIGWWRAAMEAHVNKSTYMESNFGKDLLWVAKGTSAERPMLLVRYEENGEKVWANFLDVQFFSKARQYGKAAASQAAADTKSGANKANKCPVVGASAPEAFNNQNAPEVDQTPVEPAQAESNGKSKGAKAGKGKGSRTPQCHTCGNRHKAPCKAILCSTCGEHHMKRPCSQARKDQSAGKGKGKGKKQATPDTKLKTKTTKPPAKAQEATPAPAAATQNAKPDDRKKEHILERRLKSWLSEQPTPDERLDQSKLTDWDATLVVSKAEPFADPKKGGNPIVAKLKATLKLASIQGDKFFELLFDVLDRGMTIKTASGLQVNRCLFVILACDISHSASDLFAEVLADCIKYLELADDLSNEYAALATAAVAGGRHQSAISLSKCAAESQSNKSAAMRVKTRSQAAEPAFMKVAWPFKTRGSKPFLNVYKQNGRTKFALYLLAVSETIKSELSEVVSYMLAHASHAHQMKPLKDYRLNTLKDLLRVLSRVGMQGDVSVVYCVRMEDTLAKKPPVVPSYMAGFELLNNSSATCPVVAGKPRSCGNTVSYQLAMDRATKGYFDSAMAEDAEVADNNDIVIAYAKATKTLASIPKCCGSLLWTWQARANMHVQLQINNGKLVLDSDDEFYNDDAKLLAIFGEKQYATAKVQGCKKRQKKLAQIAQEAQAAQAAQAAQDAQEAQDAGKAQQQAQQAQEEQDAQEAQDALDYEAILQEHAHGHEVDMQELYNTSDSDQSDNDSGYDSPTTQEQTVVTINVRMSDRPARNYDPTTMLSWLKATWPAIYSHLWSSIIAIDAIKDDLLKQTSSTTVRTALMPDLTQLAIPVQKEDFHPAIASIKATLISWTTSGIAFSDSMDYEVGAELQHLEDAYKALAWREAVHEVARQSSKFSLVCKAALCQAARWALKRAKLVWSQQLSAAKSITLKPSAATLIFQSTILESCVWSRQSKELGYADPYLLCLTIVDLHTWALHQREKESYQRATREPLVWGLIRNRVLSTLEQQATFSALRAHTAANPTSATQAMVTQAVLHFRETAIQSNALVGTGLVGVRRLTKHWSQILESDECSANTQSAPHAIPAPNIEHAWKPPKANEQIRSALHESHDPVLRKKAWYRWKTHSDITNQEPYIGLCDACPKYALERVTEYLKFRTTVQKAHLTVAMTEIWAIDKHHKDMSLNPPFAYNKGIKAMFRIALDKANQAEPLGINTNANTDTDTNLDKRINSSQLQHITPESLIANAKKDERGGATPRLDSVSQLASMEAAGAEQAELAAAARASVMGYQCNCQQAHRSGKRCGTWLPRPGTCNPCRTIVSFGGISICKCTCTCISCVVITEADEQQADDQDESSSEEGSTHSDSSPRLGNRAGYCNCCAGHGSHGCRCEIDPTSNSDKCDDCLDECNCECDQCEEGKFLAQRSSMESNHTVRMERMNQTTEWQAFPTESELQASIMDIMFEAYDFSTPDAGASEAAEGEDNCEHPRVLCYNGYSLVDYIEYYFCPDCGARVHVDLGSCAEVCCCHNNACTCEQDSSNESPSSSSSLGEFWDSSAARPNLAALEGIAVSSLARIQPLPITAPAFRGNTSRTAIMYHACRPDMQCICTHGQWGCMNTASSFSSFCLKCSDSDCTCECKECTNTTGEPTQQWRCICIMSGTRCILPAMFEGLCSECSKESQQHTHTCSCSCIACNPNQALCGGSDPIKPSKCACITAEGSQCQAEPLPGKEWCSNCSTRMCDCKCNGCLSTDATVKVCILEGCDREVDRSAPCGDGALACSKAHYRMAKNCHECNDPGTDEQATEEATAEPRAANWNAQAAESFEAWMQRPPLIPLEHPLTQSADVHRNALELAGNSNRITAEALGLISWGDAAPLEAVQAAAVMMRRQQRQQHMLEPSQPSSQPFARRGNVTASLEDYAADRRAADNDNNDEWARRVSRKHRISVSSSPSLRRSTRPTKQPDAFTPSNSESPMLDDSVEYSDDEELQHALQQPGIPKLITQRSSKLQGKVSSPVTPAELQQAADNLVTMVPPTHTIVPVAQLAQSERVPSSKSVAVAASARTNQSTLTRHFGSKRNPMKTQTKKASFKKKSRHFRRAKSTTITSCSITNTLRAAGIGHSTITSDHFKSLASSKKRVTSKAKAQFHWTATSNPRVGKARSYEDACHSLRAKRAARDNFWELCDEAVNSGDYKEYSRSPEYRARVLEAHADIYRAVSDSDRPLRQAARLVRSAEPDGPSRCANPNAVASYLQPAIKEGKLSQEQAQRLVNLASAGVEVKEFRDLEGKALDLSAGNTEEPEDEDILLDFYFEQSCHGRCLLLPEKLQQELDLQGELVISPSFLVRAVGKKPRAILHLSSTDKGVNQRLLDELIPDPDGYSTIKSIATNIVKTFVNMVLTPGRYDLDSMCGEELSIIVMDGDAAYFRENVHEDTIGMQAARVRRITCLLFVCSFGWRRSAEIFSHVTAGIQAVYKSDLASASLLAEQHLEISAEDSDMSPELVRLIQERIPNYSHCVSSHVDDYMALEILRGLRPKASAAALAFSIKLFLGQDGLSLKKFTASSFWSELQKVIGGWFCAKTFTVTMPRDKVLQALDLLESDEFAPHQTEFALELCQSLTGKLNWCSYTSPMGSPGCLIRIAQQRKPGEPGGRKVMPQTYHGESRKLTLIKFHNDLMIRRRFLQAALNNPRIVTCSMISVMDVADRLLVPGQSKWLVWLSGDFSLEGNSFGVEFWDPKRGHCKWWSFIKHPDKVTEALRTALAGKADKHQAIMSSVLERLNKFCAEFMWRDILAGRPVIVLDDNTGSVASSNSHYSSNVHLQAMELASSLRQSLDESRSMATYTNTLNMSWFDWSSRLKEDLMERMQQELAAAGEPIWEFKEPNNQALTCTQWLEDHLDNTEFPMLDELLQGLEMKSHKQCMPACELDPELIAKAPDLSWQKRVQAAAKPIPHFMGSFGPMAYSTDHLNEQIVGTSKLNHSGIMRLNRELARADKKWTLIDAYSGGCGVTAAAIQAGVFVKTGFDAAAEEIRVFEQMTGQINLGPINFAQFERSSIPKSHMWWSSSSCKDYSNLGSKRGVQGSKGGDHFPHQSKYAEASGSLAILWENVDGVAVWNNGKALKDFEQNCQVDGYPHFYHTKVHFSRHSNPENRERRFGVAFHNSVDVQTAGEFKFPAETRSKVCAGDILECSTSVHHKYWDSRQWYPNQGQNKQGEFTIWTLGFCNLHDTVGYPLTPSRVFHPMGLLPTCLASGNTGLVRTMRLRAMCSTYSRFASWALNAKAAASRGLLQSWEPLKGCLQNRRIMPSECLESKGYKFRPEGPDSMLYRFAGNMCPVDYTSKLIASVVKYLEQSGCTPDLTPKCDEYATFLDAKLQTKNDKQAILCNCATCPNKPAVLETTQISAAIATRINEAAFEQRKLATYLGANNPVSVRKGWNMVHNKSREQLTYTPLSEEELFNMEMKRNQLKKSQYSSGSNTLLELGIKHWYAFCNRTKLPRFLIADTPAETRAVAAQAEAFMLYELSNYDQTAANVSKKMWAVDQDHRQHGLPAPFKNNEIVQDMRKRAMASDLPSKSKVPITASQMNAIRTSLNLETREGFTLWSGLRFAIAFLCRISEWAVNENHTLTWECLTFYDKNRQVIEILTQEDVMRVYELEVIFFTDKTHGVGDGQVRQFFAIPDLTNVKCIVRDMATLWLHSDQMQDHAVFSWNNNEAGVTRNAVMNILKAAAAAVGMPECDTGTHSCRITGLSRLLAQGMPFHHAREHGRWSKNSTCVLKYFWPHTTMARDYAASIWESSTYSRVRGGGAISYL